MHKMSKSNIWKFSLANVWRIIAAKWLKAQEVFQTKFPDFFKCVKIFFLVCLESIWAIRKHSKINCSQSTALNFIRTVGHYIQRPGFMQVEISIPSAQPTVNPFFIWLLKVWINVDSKMSAYSCPTKNYCRTSSVPPHLHKAIVVCSGISSRNWVS